MHTIDHQRPRLLAIDDSVLIHRLLKARLSPENIEIHSATTGGQGLALARSLGPDVILLDVDIPDMDGFQILAELKADPQTMEIPVIFLSGIRDTHYKVRGFDLGAIDFITKPFDLAEMRARVRSALRIRLLFKMLAQRVQLDGMTGLWNRAHFDQRLREEVAGADRYLNPLSLILCDLDHFKQINDSYGHPFGDRVIEEFARLLAENREGDIACRYGGEEFAVIVPNTLASEAATIAERLCEALCWHRWPDRRDVRVTASFGVTDLSIAGIHTAAALVESADTALYAAKQAGRNQVVIAGRGQVQVRLSA